LLSPEISHKDINLKFKINALR